MAFVDVPCRRAFSHGSTATEAFDRRAVNQKLRGFSRIWTS